MTRVYVEEWLVRNSAYLNYQAIETDAELTHGVLQQFIQDKRSMSDEAIIALEKLIQYRFVDTISSI